MNTLLFKYLYSEKNFIQNSDIGDTVSLGLLSTVIRRKIHIKSEPYQKNNISLTYPIHEPSWRSQRTWSSRMLCDLSERAQGIIYSRIEDERDGKRWGRPEGRPPAASHNASSIFRCSFCRQHRISHSILREKLRWDAVQHEEPYRFPHRRFQVQIEFQIL